MGFARSLGRNGVHRDKYPVAKSQVHVRIAVVLQRTSVSSRIFWLPRSISMTSIVVKQYAPDRESMSARTHEKKLKLFEINPDAEARRTLAWGAYFWRQYRRAVSNRLASAALVSSSKDSSMKMSPKSIFISLATLVAFWAPVCLALPRQLSAGWWVPSETILWLFVIVGAWGISGVLYTCWKDTRDPEWRAAHRLPPLRSKSAAH